MIPSTCSLRLPLPAWHFVSSRSGNKRNTTCFETVVWKMVRKRWLSARWSCTRTPDHSYRPPPVAGCGSMVAFQKNKFQIALDRLDLISGFRHQRQEDLKSISKFIAIKRGTHQCFVLAIYQFNPILRIRPNLISYQGALYLKVAMMKSILWWLRQLLRMLKELTQSRNTRFA